VREQRKFRGLEELKRQIALDIELSRVLAGCDPARAISTCVA